MGMWHVLQCSWPQQCWDIVNNALTGSKLSLQSKDNTVDYKEDFNVYMSVNRRKPGTDGAFSQRKALTPCAVLDLCLVHCGKSTVNRWKMYCHCFWSRTSLYYWQLIRFQAEEINCWSWKRSVTGLLKAYSKARYYLCEFYLYLMPNNFVL